MILVKKRLEDQDAVIHAREQFICLRKSNHMVYSVKRWRQELRNVARPRIASVEVIKEIIKTIPVCKASLEDINKALRLKPGLILAEAKNRLPNQIKDFAHLFADEKDASQLPNSRGDIDHAIKIRKDDWKALAPP